MVDEPSQTGSWISEAQQGDRWALAKLLTTYHPQLRAQVEGRMDAALKGRYSPDDILQEVYLGISRQIINFEDRGQGSFRGWIDSIVNHKLNDARRRVHCQARNVDREILPAIAKTGSYWNLLDNLYTETGTPSRVLRRQEAMEALLSVLSELSEAHRQVIQLRFLKGLSVNDVAEKLNKSEAAVVSLTRRALEALRKSMDQRGEFTQGG